MRLRALFPVGMLISTICSAQTVYKCVSPSGAVTFSQSPCGRENLCQDRDGSWTKQACAAKPNKTSSSEASSPAAESIPPAPEKRSISAIEQIHASVEDSNCRRDAAGLRIVANEARLNQLYAQKRRLEIETSYANNNLAGATYESGLRSQIGSLEIAISQEQSRMAQVNADGERAFRSALADCDRKKADRERN